MRDALTAAQLRDFMRGVARESGSDGYVYFSGGASAVLFGWRDSTIDVDVKLVPDDDRVLRAIPALKERLNINVELASPSDFIPELPGWQDRSPFIAREEMLSFHHYDFYAQALAKIERRHQKDLRDVEDMVRAGLVDPERLRSLFEQIESQLYRYPAINPRAFRASIDRVLASLQ